MVTRLRILVYLPNGGRFVVRCKKVHPLFEAETCFKSVSVEMPLSEVSEKC